jgi:uncharacterized protein (TIGR02145 family)
MNSFRYIVISVLIVIGLNLVQTSAGAQQQPGTLKDRDGNTYLVKSFPDNKIWMTGNLKINIPGSYCYDDKVENCDRYGRLYTWTSAIEGCNALGEGWRLPTNKDWEQMASYFGGVWGD